MDAGERARSSPKVGIGCNVAGSRPSSPIQSASVTPYFHSSPCSRDCYCLTPSTWSRLCRARPLPSGAMRTSCCLTADAISRSDGSSTMPASASSLPVFLIISKLAGRSPSDCCVLVLLLEAMFANSFLDLGFAAPYYVPRV